jgi:hypothetical protein
VLFFLLQIREKNNTQQELSIDNQKDRNTQFLEKKLRI